jgi:protein-tyrosine-phosphatase
MNEYQAPYNVLFLCTGNSARSILGEAILNQAGNGRFRAFSAGSRPTGRVHPYALELIRRLGGGETPRSKSWNEFSGPEAPSMNFIFTVCDSAAGESCPVWTGHPMTAHWGIPDPAAVDGSDTEKRQAFADAYRRLEERIEAFVHLPIEALDEAALRRALAAIGSTDNER